MEHSFRIYFDQPRWLLAAPVSVVVRARDVQFIKGRAHGLIVEADGSRHSDWIPGVWHVERLS